MSTLVSALRLVPPSRAQQHRVRECVVALGMAWRDYVYLTILRPTDAVRDAIRGLNRVIVHDGPTAISFRVDKDDTSDLMDFLIRQPDLTEPYTQPQLRAMMQMLDRRRQERRAAQRRTLRHLHRYRIENPRARRAAGQAGRVLLQGSLGAQRDVIDVILQQVYEQDLLNRMTRHDEDQ